MPIRAHQSTPYDEHYGWMVRVPCFILLFIGIVYMCEKLLVVWPYASLTFTHRNLYSSTCFDSFFTSLLIHPSPFHLHLARSLRWNAHPFIGYLMKMIDRKDILVSIFGWVMFVSFRLFILFRWDFFFFIALSSGR